MKFCIHHRFSFSLSIYIYIYIYIYMCVCVCVCVFIYIHVFIYMYVILTIGSVGDTHKIFTHVEQFKLTQVSCILSLVCGNNYHNHRSVVFRAPRLDTFAANFTVEGLSFVFLICLFVHFCTFSKRCVRLCFKIEHFRSIACTCANVSQPFDLSTQICLKIVCKLPRNQIQVSVLAATSVFFHS